MILKKTTLADSVSQRLLNDIVMGKLVQGSKISEEELAKGYGVSRAPMREAIRQMETYQLITRKPHIGARIIKLSVEELIELYEIRESLEGKACCLAAERITNEELDELEKLLRIHENKPDVKENKAYFQQGDMDFHLLIIKASHNNRLINLMENQLYHLMLMYRYQLSTQPTRPKKALDEHGRILEALKERDGKLAELLMQRHLKRAREALCSVHKTTNYNNVV